MQADPAMARINERGVECEIHLSLFSFCSYTAQGSYPPLKAPSPFILATFTLIACRRSHLSCDDKTIQFTQYNMSYFSI